MPVPVFTSGEVLTAANMNAVGLWQIYSSSFSAVTSFSLPTDTFTSNFRNYRIIYNLTVNSDADFTLRLRKAGTDSSGGVYNTMLTGITSGAVASNSTGDSQTAWIFGEQDSVLDGYTATFDLYQPKLNTRTFATGNLVMVNKAATATIGRSGSWWHNLVDTYDSTTLISSVATSMTGVVRVYGYRD